MGQGALIFTNDVVRNVYQLGDKVVFKPNQYNGNYELKIISKEHSDGVNIADLGSGVFHLISLLVSIEIAIIDGGYYGWKENEELANSTLLVEEPEISLHPNFQSKLADVFALANKKYGVNFIIETHSEYLIRKLQYLTATNEVEYNLNTKDSTVYYLSSEKMKKINILKDGSLSDDFGKGFYDEAIGLKLELLSLKNQN